MNDFSPLLEEPTLITKDQLKHTVHKTLQYILKNTHAEFEKIVSSIKDKSDLTEALARPDFNCIPHIRDNLLIETWQKEKEALHYLLNLTEKNNLTFELFLHNLYLVEKEIENNQKIHKKYSINAYPADIEHPYFLQSIENFKYSKYLVIELTEKYQWSNLSIEKLKYVQEKYWVEIAMDDIHPIPTKENMSMDSLQKFQELWLRIDRHKMDGPFFQEMFQVYHDASPENYKNFIELMNDIITSYDMKKITIEWIETQQQYDFALQLESEFPDVEFRYQGFFFKNK